MQLTKKFVEVVNKDKRKRHLRFSLRSSYHPNYICTMLTALLSLLQVSTFLLLHFYIFLYFNLIFTFYFLSFFCIYLHLSIFFSFSLYLNLICIILSWICLLFYFLFSFDMFDPYSRLIWLIGFYSCILLPWLRCSGHVVLHGRGFGSDVNTNPPHPPRVAAVAAGEIKPKISRLFPQSAACPPRYEHVLRRDGILHQPEGEFQGKFQEFPPVGIRDAELGIDGGHGEDPSARGRIWPNPDHSYWFLIAIDRD